MDAQGPPAGFHLSLVQELPEQWINAANLVLLGALRRLAPQAINWTEMQDLVPRLDAFEEAMASKTAPTLAAERRQSHWFRISRRRHGLIASGGRASDPRRTNRKAAWRGR